MRALSCGNALFESWFKRVHVASCRLSPTGSQRRDTGAARRRRRRLRAGGARVRGHGAPPHPGRPRPAPVHPQPRRRAAPLTTEQWVTLASGAEDALEALIALLGERPSAPPLGHIARAARLLADRLPKDHPARTTAAARLLDLHEHVISPDTTLPIAAGVTSVTALERAAGATAAHLPESRLAIGEALTLDPAGDGYRVHLRPSRWSDLDALTPALRRGGATDVALVMKDLRFLRSSEPLQAAARLEALRSANPSAASSACAVRVGARSGQCAGLPAALLD
ncbi:hypothetical protein [Nonomuraea sp. NPDC048901]|uniref:hypothetical protein n=1 Tax=Nonomuraea sp. NPDC048901 TaxID=3155627 RepID=UPI0033D8A264